MMKKISFLLLIGIASFFTACFSGQNLPEIGEDKIREEKQSYLINPQGNTVEERIIVPEGFKRGEAEANSFASYLRSLPLKSHGSRVKHYDGTFKMRDVHTAVLDLDLGERDLQQCADAVIRLRAEYLYQKGQYDQISFTFTNGFRADYSQWIKGNRIKVEGNKVYWAKQGENSKDYKSFRKYLDLVFAYAGTLSLAQEMEQVEVEEMRIGDVFLKGGSPGHCVIVVDLIENEAIGERRFLLAQSYMPAQDIHILKNPKNDEQDPWYTLNFGESLNTPEWEFTAGQLYRFRD